MRLLFNFLVLFAFNLMVVAQPLSSIHDYTAKTIEGDIISLKKYAGKKLMLVNTASYCGFTPQFAILEQTYKTFRQFDFEIIGFPSNDFGSQDPNSDSSIHVFCSSNYGVTFQMMSKVAIRQGDTSDIYRWLQQKNLNGIKNQAVDWNFNKFLIDESGNWVKHYSSQTQPNDTAILHWILSPSSIKTSLNTQQNSENIFKMISSNPTDSKIEINYTGKAAYLQIALYDYKGILLEKNNQAKSDQTNSNVLIDVRDLKNGVYLLKIDNSEYAYTKRIIICR